MGARMTHATSDRRRSFAPFLTVCCAVALGSLATACSDLPSAGERVGTTNGAILEGTHDATNTYQGVVGVCRGSGVVISPYWILMAAHQTIDHDGNDSLCRPDFNVGDTLPAGANQPGVSVIGFGPEGTEGRPDLAHTYSTSGMIYRRSDLLVDEWDYESVAQDLAVFRLDTPVPRSFVRPIQPPILAGEAPCADSGDMTIVGFGGSTLWGDACDNQNPTGRNSLLVPADDVDRTLAFAGSVFAYHYYDVTPCDHGGTTKGDSGGAWLDAANPDRLCGITSGLTQSAGWIADAAAAIDSDVTDTWQGFHLEGPVTWLTGLSARVDIQPRHHAAIFLQYDASISAESVSKRSESTAARRVRMV